MPSDEPSEPAEPAEPPAVEAKHRVRVLRITSVDAENPFALRFSLTEPPQLDDPATE